MARHPVLRDPITYIVHRLLRRKMRRTSPFSSCVRQCPSFVHESSTHPPSSPQSFSSGLSFITRRPHRSQIPQPSLYAPPCLGWPMMRPDVVASQGRPYLQTKRRSYHEVSPIRRKQNKKRRMYKYIYARDRRRSILPPSAAGSRSAARATAAAASARALASSALSSWTSASAARSDDACVVCECGALRLPADLSCDLWVPPRDVVGDASSSSP